jgi:uncharacterized damage-inducible protein DinB
MKRFMTLVAVVGLLVAASAAAEDHEHDAADMAKAGDVRAEWATNFNYAAEKLIQLAEEVPQDKYTWRPAEGVRSFSEAFMHAAGANYFITAFCGVKVPEGIDRDTFEKSTTDKAEIIEAMKKSVAHAKAAMHDMSDADLDTKVDWFFGKGSKREVMYFVAAHDHEHLGQLIAYARMNGITPPWSKKK